MIDEQIRALCERKGLIFRPWEIHPADVNDGPSPWPRGSAGSENWPKAQKLRKALIAELHGKQ
jgi:hypothetical protein